MAKPASHIDWTDGDAAKVTEPTVGKKLLGWVGDERPSFKFMNFLFFRLDEWIKYFETETDLLIAGNPGFDAVVGSGGSTFADINAAVAAVSPGGRILVTLPLALAVTQVVDKDDIEITFKPLATLSQPTTLPVGLRLDAERIKIIRPRFADWDNTAGDFPLEFTANAKNCMVETPYFFNIANPAPVNDLGLNNTVSNPVEEQ